MKKPKQKHVDSCKKNTQTKYDFGFGLVNPNEASLKELLEGMGLDYEMALEALKTPKKKSGKEEVGLPEG